MNGRSTQNIIAGSLYWWNFVFEMRLRKFNSRKKNRQLPRIVFNSVICSDVLFKMLNTIDVPWVLKMAPVHFIVKNTFWTRFCETMSKLCIQLPFIGVLKQNVCFSKIKELFSSTNSSFVRIFNSSQWVFFFVKTLCY